MAMHPTPTPSLAQPQLPLMPTERSFGFFFAAMLGGLALYGLWRHWALGACIALGLAGALMLCLALVAPKSLSGLNRAWFRLGLLLGALVTPLVLGLIFFVLLTPVACVTRLFGRDALRMRRPLRTPAAKPVSKLEPRPDAVPDPLHVPVPEPAAFSYWLERNPPGVAPGSFKQQF